MVKMFLPFVVNLSQTKPMRDLCMCVHLLSRVLCCPLRAPPWSSVHTVWPCTGSSKSPSSSKAPPATRMGVLPKPFGSIPPPSSAAIVSTVLGTKRFDWPSLVSFNGCTKRLTKSTHCPTVAYIEDVYARLNHPLSHGEESVRTSCQLLFLNNIFCWRSSYT